MIAKNILERLYLEKKLSVAEIAQRLQTTYPTAVYWTKKHRIPIRSQSERTYVKRNPGGDPFHPKQPLTMQEQKLLLIGLALYWGEGSRKSRHAVQLANLDHRMLQLFVRFLREVVGVTESRLRLDVRVYHGFDKYAAHRYWSRTLAIHPKQVFIYPHIDTRSQVNKLWSPYGIATLCVGNVKLKTWIDQQLEMLIQQFIGPSKAFRGRFLDGRPGFVRETPGRYEVSAFYDE